MQKTRMSTAETRIPKPDTLTVTGPTKLSGHVSISCSKNSSLSLLPAPLLCSNSSLLHSVPTNLTDTKAMVSILRSLGAEIEVNAGNNDVLVNSAGVRPIEPCMEEMKKIRGGYFVIGPLLAWLGESWVCNWSDACRPARSWVESSWYCSGDK